MPTRREFFTQSAVTATGVLGLNASLAVPALEKISARTRKPLNLLFLGGTGYIGPFFVKAAVERGHRVSVFSRGKDEANLPSVVERLVGDRDNDLRSIQGRVWDAAIDLATFGPAWIQRLGANVGQRIKHYTFISTIDVYDRASSNPNGTDESCPVLEYKLDLDPYSYNRSNFQAAAVRKVCLESDSPESCLLRAAQYQYGALKVLCEKEAEKQYPGKTLVVRPGYMVGPRDPQARLEYWVARMEKGGEIVAPGNPLEPVQFIDVRDVGDWVISMVEDGATGTFNALGPGNSMSLCEMLGGIRSIFGVPMKLTWVSNPWIKNQDVVDPEVAGWDIWQFSRDDGIRSDKAVSRGLTYRPFSITARDTLEWHKSKSLKEQEVLITGLKVDDIGTLKSREISHSWSEIMQREKEIIRRWQVHQSRL